MIILKCKLVVDGRRIDNVCKMDLKYYCCAYSNVNVGDYVLVHSWERKNTRLALVYEKDVYEGRHRIDHLINGNVVCKAPTTDFNSYCKRLYEIFKLYIYDELEPKRKAECCIVTVKFRNSLTTPTKGTGKPYRFFCAVKGIKEDDFVVINASKFGTWQIAHVEKVEPISSDEADKVTNYVYFKLPVNPENVTAIMRRLRRFYYETHYEAKRMAKKKVIYKCSKIQ